MLHGAAQYRVGAQLGVDPQVPLVGFELRGEHRRAAPLPGLQYLEQVDRVERVLGRRREEVAQDEQVRPREAVERVVDAPLAARHARLAEHVVEPRAAHGHQLPAGRDAEGLRDAALAAAALQDDDEALARLGPRARRELRYPVARYAAVGEVVDVLDARALELEARRPHRLVDLPAVARLDLGVGAHPDLVLEGHVVVRLVVADLAQPPAEGAHAPPRERGEVLLTENRSHPASCGSSRRRGPCRHAPPGRRARPAGRRQGPPP